MKSETVTFTPTTDTDVEADETVQLSLSNLSPAALAGDINIAGTGTVTIQNDDAGVILSNVSGAENGGPITVTATLQGTAGGAFTVDLAVANVTASNTDYTLPGSLEFSFAGTTSGETQTLQFTPVNDNIVEANETLNLSLTNSSNASIDISSTATATISNDDAAAITIADVSGAENDGAITLTATLDNAVQGGFSVDVNSADGTATTADNDYTAISQTLTFAGTAGETRTFSFTPSADAKVEADEIVTFSLSNLGGTAAAVDITDNATATITNDDAAAVTIADVSGNENDGAITLTATLDDAVQGGFSVDVLSADGTATTADGDYTAVSTTLNFAGTAGETQTFTFSPSADAKVEADETVTFSLSNLSGTSLAVDITDDATATITNDDAAAVTIADVSGNENDGSITLTATLDNAVAGGFSVDVNSADGTATTADNDYTAVSQTLSFTGTAGETQSFTFTPSADAKVEADETVTFSLSNLSGTSLAVDITDDATATITNDDAAAVTIADVSGNENDGSITLTATLDNAVAGGFSVDVNSADGTATTADNDYSATTQTLSFTGTAGETQSFTFTPSADAKVEADETITFSLSNLSGTSLTVDITDDATATITNDDAAAVTIADVSGAENGGAITLTATLDNAVAGGFSVDVNSADGTATTADNDYTAIAGRTLTFTGTVGETQSFTFTPSADAKVEADETVTFSLSNLSGTSLTVDITDDATATITNDDAAGFSLSPSSLLLNENGNRNFVVVLNAQPQSVVVFSIVSGDASEATVSTANLTFTPANWNQPQTVTVSGVDDGLTDGDQSLNVTIAVDAAVSDSFFSGLSSQTVAVTVQDTDTAPAFTSSSYTFQLDANAAIGAVAGTLIATDNDGDIPSYSVSGSSNFAINSAGEVTVVSNNGFAAGNTYQLQVQATDGQQTASASVSIELISVNGQAPVFTSATTFAAAENQTAAAQLTATDADPNSTLRFSLEAGLSSSLFSINSVTGELRFNNAPNFEQPAGINGSNVHLVNATVSDGLNETTQRFTIVVQNVNEAPVINTTTAIELPLGAPRNTLIGQVNATDPEGDELRFRMLSPANPFWVDQNGFIYITDPNAIDFSSGSSYTLEVEAYENNRSRGLTDSATITIIASAATLCSTSRSAATALPEPSQH